MIIDTSILIDALRGTPAAEAFIDQQSVATTIYAHGSVVGELLQGARNSAEIREIDDLIEFFQFEHPTVSDSVAALALLRQFTLSHRIGYVDCLLAATALRLNVPLVTTNEKHFRAIPNLTIIRPY